MQEQLSLPVNLPDDQTLNSFVVGQNGTVVAHLNNVLNGLGDIPPLTFVGGDSGAGKTHLLYGICHATAALNKHAAYLDLALIEQLQPALLTGLEQYDVVCLDNVQQLHQQPKWQEALFDLINRCIESGRCHLVITADCGPKSVPLELPDLGSRLAWGTSFMLASLDDGGLQQMLMQRAKLRGITMSADVAQFILNRYTRHSQQLMALLAKLDNLSLQQQKKLTIPFVKQVLSL